MNKRRLKSLIAFSLLVIILLVAGIILRNFFLNQVKKQIRSAFNYSKIHLSLFPPTIVFDDIRTVSPSPFFFARKVAVKISYLSLLSREKPLIICVDQPVLRISEPVSKEEKKNKPKLLLPLPFAIEAGLIRGGEVYFWGKESRFRATGVNALLKQKGDYFSIKAESDENALFWNQEARPLEGKLRLAVEGRGRKVSVKRIVIDGPDFLIKANGVLTNISDPEGELKTSFQAETGLVAALLGLPFEWKGKAQGEGKISKTKGEWTFRADLSSENLILNKFPFARVEGRINLKGGGSGTVELSIPRKATLPEKVRIDFGNGKVAGSAQAFYLDPIINYVAIPWPVKSPVWGNFSINNGKLEADAQFRDEELIPFQDRYPFQGAVKFAWDGEKQISFSSEKLLSSFGLLDVRGEVSIGQSADVSIQGEVSDVKQAREFVSLVLGEPFNFPEIRGKGNARVAIGGSYQSPEVKADFTCSPGGFDKFDAASVTGHFEFLKKTFIGKFKVEDPDLKGEINLLSNPERLDVEIQAQEGRVEKILPGLEIPIPLTGRASGVFHISEKDDELQVTGDFSSSTVNFFKQPLTDVSGSLEWKKDTLSFPRLSFRVKEGQVRGNLIYGFVNEQYDFDLTAEKISLSSFAAGLQGDLSFNLKAKGLLGENPAVGQFAIANLRYSSLQETEAKGEFEISSQENNFGFKLKGNLSPGANDFSVSANIPAAAGPIPIDVKGSFRNLDFLLPWQGAKGQINYIAEIKAGVLPPQVNGVIDVQGSLLPFPKFAHALTDYSGLIFVQNGRISIRSFQGKLGGGDIQGFGEVVLGKGGVEKIDVSLEGKNMLLSPLERTRALADGTLQLVKEESRLSLEGNFSLQRLSWRREIFEKFAFSSSPYSQTQKEPTFFDNLDLNIRLKADDNAWMENSLGRIRARLDLSITGNVNSPILLGDIEALGGEVYFQDRKFRILKGRASFFNPSSAEPYLDFKGETYVKDYRVSFSLSGLTSQLRPEFSSSPPLPPEDVLALLALGESFKRTYSYDTSTRLSTASFLSFQLAEEAKKRAEKIFSLDRFRIDPFVLGSSAQMTARLTVGKKISRNLLILYSTNLTTQREEIVRMEWDLNDEFSVVGIRDEIGRISFDVKIRKRF